MAKILLEVRDNVLIASTEGVITSDTISVPCSISFSDEWAPYGKTIFFYQNPRKMHRVVVAGQSADFEVPPQAIITGGELHIGVFGNYTDGEGDPQRKVAVATSVPASKGSYSGTDLPKPSVSEYEQIISIMMAYADAREVAEIAKEAAEQISTEAINAKAYITKTVDEATAEISDDVAKAKNDLMEATNNATDQIAADANTVKGYVGQASAHAATAQTAAAASASARDESLAAISEALSARDEVVEVAEEALNKMGGYNAKVEKNSKRATNAEDASTVKIPDSSVAYTKTVPENALPYAEITEIGGMTRKCTNLIPYPYNLGTTTIGGVTFTDNGDGTITVNGTSTSSTYGLGTITLRSGKPYYLSGCPAGGGNNTYRLFLWNTSASAATGADYGSGCVITPTEDVECEVRIYCVSGSVLNNLVFKPMLNEGSTALPYEPYFEGLRSAPVTAVERVGANLASFDNLVGITWDGIIWSVKDNVITAKGTSIAAYNTCPVDCVITGMKGTFYISDSNTDITVRMQITNATGVTTYVTRGSFTLDGTETRARIVAQIDNVGKAVDASTQVMLNKGSTALPYTPYFKRTIEIPEAVRALEGYGWGVSEDVYNYIDLEKEQFAKYVGRVDMGTLTWRKDADYGNYYYATLADKKANVSMNLLCSKYTTTRSYGNEAPDKTIRGHDTTKNNLLVRDEDYTDAVTFKAAMSGVMLYYELAEPIITDISDILPADNFIQVEEGGTVTMVNEYEYDVPSTVVYRVPKVGDDYVMISSPNGTVYKLTVSDSGSISAVKT